jgi:hypothetical protein
LDAAEGWLRRALAAFERAGNEHDGSIIGRSLDRLAKLRDTRPENP